MARKSHANGGLSEYQLANELSDEELRSRVLELRNEPMPLVGVNEELEAAEEVARDRGMGLGMS
jgi:hypothetical protein